MPSQTKVPKPDFKEIEEFKEFLAELDFSVLNKIDPNEYRLPLDYGALLVKFNYNSRNKFSNISIQLEVYWEGHGSAKDKFPSTYPMAFQVQTLDRDLIHKSIRSAKDCMDEIRATIGKIATIIHVGYVL